MWSLNTHVMHIGDFTGPEMQKGHFMAKGLEDC